MVEPEGPLSKRRYPRRVFYRRVGVLYKGKYLIGNGKEIGEGGMLIDVPLEMSEGDILVVNFLLDNGFCPVRAEVRSIYPGESSTEYGLLFLNLSYEGKKGIREYIAAKSEEESRLEQQANRNSA